MGGNDQRKMGKCDDQGETCMNKDLHTRKKEKGRKKSIKEKKSGQGWNRNIIFSYNNQGSIDDMIKG